MSTDGWRALADYFEELRETRWARLTPEESAAACWPLFLKAVAAAHYELGLRPGRAPTDATREASRGEPPKLPDIPPA